MSREDDGLQEESEQEVEGALEQIAIQEEIKELINMINKRIDFDSKTFRRLETMMPIYTQDDKGLTSSEMYSLVIRKAVNALFEGDFKSKLEEL